MSEKTAFSRKIIHISFFDSKGGAAIAAYRLHKAMLDCGLDSSMVVVKGLLAEDDIHPLFRGKASYFLNRVRMKLLADKRERVTRKRGLYSVFDVGNDIRHCSEIMDADVIYLHWICRGMLSYRDIRFLLEQKKQVYWFMHDMFAMTGGCHHAFNCTGYQGKCANCPFFKEGVDSAEKQLRAKTAFKKYSNMHWIVPSRWMFEQAESSKAIDKDRLYLIPNVISGSFYPIDTEKARRALGLPLDKQYILFGADAVLKNPYKGLPYFVRVMRSCYEHFSAEGTAERVEVLLFGAEQNEAFAKLIPFKINFMGVVGDEKKMALLYNAANVLIVTSTAENYPLVVQEAVFCGTPVTAFGVGGIPEIITDKSKGAVTDCFDTRQMTEAVVRILSSKCEKRNESGMNEAFRRRIIEKHMEMITNDDS